MTVHDFINLNSKKTIWLMVLFSVSLMIMTYIAILLTSMIIIHDSNQSYSSIANKTAIEILPFALIISILWIFINYFIGQKFILSTTKSFELTAKNAPEIMHIVKNVAVAAGLSMPKVYVINDSALNAFATGRNPKHSCIALTKGIIDKLDRKELEGVIAHEIAHIKNKDTKLMLITITCIGFATIISELLLHRTLTFRTKNSKNNSIQLLLFSFAIIFYIYGYLLAPLIKLALSRTREFQADATAAIITQNPQGLINALKKISSNPMVKQLNNRKIISMICIANPLLKKNQNSLFLKISGLFATHPTITDRIIALEAMKN
ncbi:MAG: M48 family metallopeptidase [Endomicrobium sp.]|jgi:heat shock protein HtpX|nr:M48 family metallopeptidase [Endomicrobium sp.]